MEVEFIVVKMVLAVESADRGLCYEFAVDRFRLDEILEGVEVAKLEVWDRGIMRVLRRCVNVLLYTEGRAGFTSKSNGWQCPPFCDILRQPALRRASIRSRMGLTRPVAPQQASRASNITTSRLPPPLPAVFPSLSRW